MLSAVFPCLPPSRLRRAGLKDLVHVLKPGSVPFFGAAKIDSSCLLPLAIRLVFLPCAMHCRPFVQENQL